MIEMLLILIVLLLLVSLFRLSVIRNRLEALSRLDGKVDALLEESGVEFDPFADVPSDVAEAIRRGKKLQAIKNVPHSHRPRAQRVQRVCRGGPAAVGHGQMSSPRRW